jgi:hypothetical protein
MPAKGTSTGAKTTPKKAGKAAATKAAPAAAAKPARAKAAPAPAPSTDAGSTEPTQAATPTAEPEVDESSVPMNRAERRAKGRGKPLPQTQGHGKVSGGHGPTPTHRMWANRRSG